MGDYLRRIQTADLSYPLAEEVSEDELLSKLFPVSVAAAEPVGPLPDWAEIQKELSNKRRHAAAAVDRVPRKAYRWVRLHPITQYCEYYRRWSKTQALVARIPHKSGEEMEVDYSGLMMTITNPETGKVRQASVFVPTLPAINYLYAEVQPSQESCHWINGHVRAFEFFGGVTRILLSDNPKTGVTRPDYYEPDLNPSYQVMAEYYQVVVPPARVRKPRDYPEDL